MLFVFLKALLLSACCFVPIAIPFILTLGMTSRSDQKRVIKIFIMFFVIMTIMLFLAACQDQGGLS
mgnify:CR=1 FL=1